MVVTRASGSTGWSGFVKTISIPLLIALLLYTTIFYAVIPLYRRYQTHIARYSSYTPLNSSLAAQTTSLFNPIIQPSRSLWERSKRNLRMLMWRWAVPGVLHVDLSHQADGTGEDDELGDEEMMADHRTGDMINQNDNDDNDLDFSSEDEAGRSATNRSRNPQNPRSHVHAEGDSAVLFDDYTASNMVGFDIRSSSGDGRRFGLGHRRAQSQTQARTHPGISRTNNQRRGMERRRIGGPNPDELTRVDAVLVHSDSRLSRDLEQGFRDDSSDDSSDETHDVTVGRASLGRR